MKVDMVQNGQKVSVLFKFHFLEIWNSNSLFVYKCNHETYSSETFLVYFISSRKPSQMRAPL